MKLKFVDQPYQNDAVNAICDIFNGCEAKDSIFTIVLSVIKICRTKLKKYGLKWTLFFR